MKIGVIGANYIGGSNARKLKDVGHPIRIANPRGPKSIQAFADEIGEWLLM